MGKWWMLGGTSNALAKVKKKNVKSIRSACGIIPLTNRKISAHRKGGNVNKERLNISALRGEMVLGQAQNANGKMESARLKEGRRRNPKTKNEEKICSWNV